MGDTIKRKTTSTPQNVRSNKPKETEEKKSEVKPEVKANAPASPPAKPPATIKTQAQKDEVVRQTPTAQQDGRRPTTVHSGDQVSFSKGEKNATAPETIKVQIGDSAPVTAHQVDPKELPTEGLRRAPELDTTIKVEEVKHATETDGKFTIGGAARKLWQGAREELGNIKKAFTEKPLQTAAAVAGTVALGAGLVAAGVVSAPALLTGAAIAGVAYGATKVAVGVGLAAKRAADGNYDGAEDALRISGGGMASLALDGLTWGAGKALTIAKGSKLSNLGVAMSQNRVGKAVTDTLKTIGNYSDEVVKGVKSLGDNPTIAGIGNTLRNVAQNPKVQAVTTQAAKLADDFSHTQVGQALGSTRDAVDGTLTNIGNRMTDIDTGITKQGIDFVNGKIDDLAIRYGSDAHGRTNILQFMSDNVGDVVNKGGIANGPVQTLDAETGELRGTNTRDAIEDFNSRNQRADLGNHEADMGFAQYAYDDNPVHQRRSLGALDNTLNKGSKNWDNATAKPYGLDKADNVIDPEATNRMIDDILAQDPSDLTPDQQFLRNAAEKFQGKPEKFSRRVLMMENTRANGNTERAIANFVDRMPLSVSSSGDEIAELSRNLNTYNTDVNQMLSKMDAYHVVHAGDMDIVSTHAGIPTKVAPDGTVSLSPESIFEAQKHLDDGNWGALADMQENALPWQGGEGRMLDGQPSLWPLGGNEANFYHDMPGLTPDKIDNALHDIAGFHNARTGENLSDNLRMIHGHEWRGAGSGLNQVDSFVDNITARNLSILDPSRAPNVEAAAKPSISSMDGLVAHSDTHYGDPILKGLASNEKPNFGQGIIDIFDDAGNKTGQRPIPSWHNGAVMEVDPEEGLRLRRLIPNADGTDAVLDAPREILLPKQRPSQVLQELNNDPALLNKLTQQVDDYNRTTGQSLKVDDIVSDVINHRNEAAQYQYDAISLLENNLANSRNKVRIRTPMETLARMADADTLDPRRVGLFDIDLRVSPTMGVDGAQNTLLGLTNASDNNLGVYMGQTNGMNGFDMAFGNPDSHFNAVGNITMNPLSLGGEYIPMGLRQANNFVDYSLDNLLFRPYAEE